MKEFYKNDSVVLVKKFKRKRKQDWYNVCGGYVKNKISFRKTTFYYCYWFFQKDSGYAWFKEDAIFTNLDPAYLYKKRKNDEVGINDN